MPRLRSACPGPSRTIVGVKQSQRIPAPAADGILLSARALAGWPQYTLV